MRDLTTTLLAAQKEQSREALWKIILSKTGETTLTYEADRIKYLQHRGGESNQSAQVLLDNSDHALRDLALEGYQADVYMGCVTALGEEYSQEAPLWVLTQQLYDLQSGALLCNLNLGGIMNLLNLDKASAVYEPDSGDTRTVKDWLTEIISLTDSASESDEEQTSSDGDWQLYSGASSGNAVSQKLTISDRRVTKLAFKLKKVGNPTGDVIFFIYSETGGYLAYQTWGAAADLGTTYAWCEITLETPVNVDEEVRVACGFNYGDSSNYVAVEYNSTSVKALEALSWYDTAWNEEATYDLVYRYSYSATPITGYSHCTSIGLVFDSEDDIIDSYEPQDSLRIAKGQTRKALVEMLLGWTGCAWRPENDGKIHIFVPKKDVSTAWVADTAYSLRDEIIPTTANGYVYICTTAGTSGSSEPTWATGIGDTIVDGTVVWTVAYDYEFELAKDDAGKHTFYDKAYNHRLVMPSKITVASRSTDSPSYSGSAETSDHSSRTDNLKKQDFIELRIASDAEGASIADAMIAKLERDAETGSALVPMNVGSEVFDFVNFVSEREGVSRNGVIRQITKTCKGGEGDPEFQMQVRFGLVAGEATLGIMPTSTKPMSMEMNFLLLVEEMKLLQENLTTLWGNYDAIFSNQELIISRLEDMKEYILVAELHAYSTLRIPSEAA